MARERRLCHAQMGSPLGTLLVSASAHGITGVHMENEAHPPAPESLGERLGSVRDDLLVAQCAAELTEYFAQRRTVFDVPLDAEGTEFQHRVWDKLSKIPFGASRTYGDIALELGDVKLTRAVGTANGRNPIAIIVPCHRVIGADGSLTGYAGGLGAKLFLLRLEGIVPQAEATLF